MTIWCGTDFSPSADEAARAAVALARRMGGPVRLLHIVDEILAEHTFESAEGAVYDPLRTRMQERVSQLQAESPGLELTGAVLPGIVEEALTGWAERPGDLLVLGALGQRPNAARWLLGSVADRSAQRAQTPVLVIRRAGAFSDWSVARPLRVVIGIDLSVQCRAAVQFVESLRRLAPCDVTLVHVLLPDGLERRRLGVSPGEGDREAAALVERELRRDVGPLDGAGSVSWRIEPPSEHVERVLAACSTTADLLVLGTHQRTGLSRAWYGAVSRAALTASRTNVALVPAAALVEEKEPVPCFREVLVPLDLSPASLRAIPYSLGLLRAGGTLHLLNVVDDEPLTPALATARETALADSAERLVQGRGRTLKVHVVADGNVSAAILQAATRLGVDALCMVPRRQRALVAELVLGSTSREVLRYSRYPVLLVPPGGE